MASDLASLLARLPPELASEVTLALDRDGVVTNPPPEPAERYTDLGALGTGGMGEVRRVRDVALNRVVALKRLRPDRVSRPEVLTRFVAEAQATAQLQHPGIAPVYDARLSGGAAWFTMKEIDGRTLGEVIDEVHEASGERFEPAPSGWTFRRLLSAFLDVCNAMAYAHARGVLHRDLKPDNVMVGPYGEVYVIDWGLAKVIGAREDGVRTDVSDSGSDLTRDGSVAGTPAYMPPEQARGDVEALDERSDVYALGAILYEVLSGRRPYEGSAFEVLAAVVAGPPPPPLGRVPVPEELVAACGRAMARRPEARFPTAAALADEIEAWLDGARRREQGLQLVAEALARDARTATLRATAAALRARADALLADVKPWQPERDKAAGWGLHADADAAELAATLEAQLTDLGLHAALRVADLPEAHVALIARYRARHAEAEAARDARATAEAAALLASHAEALPPAHPHRARTAAYLEGTGALTLHTDPPGAEVRLYRYEARNRRLVEVFVRSLGRTPLHAVPLPIGSFLCVVHHPDRAEVRYPVAIPRQGHWDGVPPGEAAPRPIWLPPRGALDPDHVYVPAGWFRAGGDVSPWPERRLWCDGFVIDRFPVTNADYIRFLDELVARGRVEEALELAPRERLGPSGAPPPLLYGFDGARFSLITDPDGDEWVPDAPVVSLDHFGASAFLAWRAERTGRPWRLPDELRWEKAARGVDARAYPWGDHFEVTWCHALDSDPTRRGPVRVDSYPVDVSPYGARGLGGNVRDWCFDLYHAPPSVDGERVVTPDVGDPDVRALRTIRGGAWETSITGRNARATFRNRAEHRSRQAVAGFRGLYEV